MKAIQIDIRVRTPAAGGAAHVTVKASGYQDTVKEFPSLVEGLVFVEAFSGQLRNALCQLAPSPAAQSEDGR